MGAHCVNHNKYSIGVCYIGGLAADGVTPADTRTEAQKKALQKLLADLQQRYPKALVLGHCELDRRKPHCPGFKVPSLRFNQLQVTSYKLTSGAVIGNASL